MLKAMQAYKDVEYDGLLLPDHLPRMVGDTRYQHVSRAYAVGYIKALMAAVNAG